MLKLCSNYAQNMLKLCSKYEVLKSRESMLIRSREHAPYIYTFFIFKKRYKYLLILIYYMRPRYCTSRTEYHL